MVRLKPDLWRWPCTCHTYKHPHNWVNVGIAQARHNKHLSSITKYPPACRKVFIVYHKDSHITEIQIEGLCDILNKLWAKGFVCDCDVLHRTEPGINWNNWTERMIEEADFVLLVCSPQLYGCLSQAKSSPLIHTAVAVISGAAIANLCSISTDSSKFIPVFLNQNVDRKFVPNSLKSHKVYELITTGLMKIPSNGIPCWQISSRNTRVPWSKWSWDQGSVRVGGLSQTIDLQTRICMFDGKNDCYIHYIQQDP